MDSNQAYEIDTSLSCSKFFAQIVIDSFEGDPSVLNPINEILHEIIINNESSWIHNDKNAQADNAFKSILFEAIQLAVHINPHSKLVQTSTIALYKYLCYKNTNIRYLALKSLSNIHKFVDASNNFVENHQLVLDSLKDRDKSIKSSALELICSQCTSKTAKKSINDILQFLAICDTDMKEDTIMKIVLLVEKFATGQAWYIDTFIQLSQYSTSKNLWQTAITSIRQHQYLFEYATLACIEALSKSENINQILLKLCGWILGEYGELIVEMEGCSAIQQFTQLQRWFEYATSDTQCLLLTTYYKFCVRYTGLREYIMPLFDQCRNDDDLDTSQRAKEYFCLLNKQEFKELATKMFECSQNTTVSQLGSKSGANLYRTQADQETNLMSPYFAS